MQLRWYSDGSIRWMRSLSINYLENDELGGKIVFYLLPSGRLQANRTPPPLVKTYCRWSSSYVIGELAIWPPVPACHRVVPSLVSRARALPLESPVNVTPESVVNTPAEAPSPISWRQRIFPVQIGRAHA